MDRTVSFMSAMNAWGIQPLSQGTKGGGLLKIASFAIRQMKHEPLARAIRCAIQYHEPFGRFNKRGDFVRTVADVKAVIKIANIAAQATTDDP